MSGLRRIDTQSTRTVIIEVPKPRKSHIEAFLDEINPAWKKGPLFSWQWDEHERPELSPAEVYVGQLEGFEVYGSKSRTAVVLVKRKRDLLLRNRGLFIVDNGYGSFRNVLTNVSPYSNEEYAQSSLEDEVTLDQLRERNLSFSERDELVCYPRRPEETRCF